MSFNTPFGHVRSSRTYKDPDLMKTAGVMDTNGTWMDRHGDKQPVFGEAIQAVMATRGHELTLEEAQQLTHTLLNLIELGALVPVDAGDGSSQSLERQ